jgi:hypothetical protein
MKVFTTHNFVVNVLMALLAAIAHGVFRVVSNVGLEGIDSRQFYIFMLLGYVSGTFVGSLIGLYLADLIFDKWRRRTKRKSGDHANREMQGHS